eukprot:gene10097-2517_t
MSVEEIVEEEIKNFDVISNDKINFEILYRKFSKGSPTVIKKTIKQDLFPFFEKNKVDKKTIANILKIIFLSVSTFSQKETQSEISQLLKMLAKKEEEKFQVLNLFLNSFKKTKIQDFSTSSRIALITFFSALSVKLTQDLLKEVYGNLISIMLVSFQRDYKFNMNSFIHSKISRKVQNVYVENKENFEVIINSLSNLVTDAKYMQFVLSSSTFLEVLKKKRFEQDFNKNKPTFLKLFSTTIFKQIEVSDSTYWNSFSFLVENLKDDEIKEISDVLANGMRRSSETIIPTCLWFIKSLKNYSKHLEVLISPISEQLISKNEKQSKFASEFCLVVSMKAKSKDVLTQLIKENFRLLKGSGLGVSEKICCLTSIKNLADTPVDISDLNSISEMFIFPTLKQLIQQKSNPDALRNFSLETLASWINKSQTIPGFIELDFSSIFDGEKLNTVLIQGLTSFLGDLFSMKPVNKLMNKLTSIINLSEKKIGDRGNGILAERALLKYGLEFPDSKKDVEKVFSKSMIGPNSFLITPDMISKYENSALLAMPELYQSFFAGYLDLLNTEKDTSILISLFHILCNNDYTVRKKMKEVVQSLLKADDKLYQVLCQGAFYFLESLEENHQLDKKLIAQALLLVFPSPSVDFSLFKKILFYSHFPTAVDSSDFTSIWTSYVLKHKDIDVSSLLKNVKDCYETLIQFKSVNVQCVGYSLSSVISCVGNEASNYILQTIHSKLFASKQQLDKYTIVDIDVYFTPKDKVYRDVENEVYNPLASQDHFGDSRDDPNMKYDLTDEEWQDVFSQEQILKKKKNPMDSQQMRVQLLTEKFLKKENIIREELAIIYDNISFELNNVASICQNSKGFQYLRNSISYVSVIVAEFLASKLVCNDAFKAFKALSAVCLPYKSISKLIAEVTFRLFAGDYDESRIKDEDDDVSFGEHVITKMRLTAKGIVDAETFSTILPLIVKILMRDDLDFSLACRTISMNILSSHAGLGTIRPNYVRPSITETLVAAMEHYPSMYKQIHQALIASGQFLKPVDLNPLLDGLLHTSANIRFTCLTTLNEYIPLMKSKPKISLDAFKPENEKLNSYLWITLNDPIDKNSEFAKVIWDRSNQQLENNFMKYYLPLLNTSESVVRKMISLSISKGLESFKDLVTPNLKNFYQLFEDSKVEAGLKSYEPYEKENNIRMSIATTLGDLSNSFAEDDFIPFFEFVVKTGLYDPIESIKEEIQNSALKLISNQGKKYTDLIYKFCQNFLSTNKPKSNAEDDFVFSSCVILLGSVSTNFESGDEKLENVIERLLKCLSVPSSSVQRSVSNVLTPLASKSERKEEIIADFLVNITKGDYGDKRGSCYGLAGFLRGLGINSLKKYHIMERLDDYASSDDDNERESSMIAYELLANKFGMLFEPYLLYIIPNILLGFGDFNEDVRLAANDTSNLFMTKISEHGVRIILPGILDGLNDDSWRTKKGCVQLLGSMAYMAPRQLSNCLPVVVESLGKALTDTHTEVAVQAKTSLSRIGGVVGNPEIAQQVPQLLQAINNPDTTESALDNLIYTRFIHSIDPASMSLLIPVIVRGLKDRIVECKKKSAIIVANMSSLVDDESVLAPYINILIPLLQTILIDPNPDVRAAGAKAIGVLATSIRTNTEAVLPWLLSNVQKATSSAERAGAAQALAEYMNAQKTNELFEKLLPEFLDSLTDDSMGVRHGTFQLFVYLPALLKDRFAPYLATCVPKILEGISDEEDLVREVAIQACKIIVNLYSISSVNLILPSLLEGIQDDHWRTRQCSIVILGDFIDRIADSIDDKKHKDVADITLIDIDAARKVLGDETIDDILSQVFLLQFDINTNVKSEAITLWKSVISNTARALRDIMKPLISLIIEFLSYDADEHKEMAAKSLGDLVKRLGHRVIGEVIPLLEEGLKSDDVDTRQGSCIGLTELMDASPKHIGSFKELIIPAVTQALCDEDESVQEVASATFDELCKCLGTSVIEVITENILQSCLKGDDNSLNGLKQIVKVRAKNVLQNLIPILSVKPLPEVNAKALSAIAGVSGSYLTIYLDDLLDFLFEEYSANPIEAIQDALESTSLSVSEESLPIYCETLSKVLKSNNSVVRETVGLIAKNFFTNTSITLSEEVPTILESLLAAYIDPEPKVVKSSVDAINTLITSLEKEDLPNHIIKAREVVKDISEDEKGKKTLDTIPGFNIPNGIQGLTTMYLEGLLHAKNNDIREQAALALGEMIELTGNELFNKMVIKITGPLIRIVGDRNPWQVKAAILSTLNIVLEKGGIKLKPFIPQLQTIFIKSLQDQTKLIRNYAAESFGKLVQIGAKVDNLVNELHSNLKTFSKTIDTVNIGILKSVLFALELIIKLVGNKIKKSILESLMETLQSIMHLDEDITSNCSATIGVCVIHIENSKDFIANLLSLKNNENLNTRISILTSLLKNNNSTTTLPEGVVPFIALHLKHVDDSVRKFAIKAAVQYFTIDLSKDLVSTFVQVMTEEKVGENRFECLRLIKWFSKKNELDVNLLAFAPAVLKLVKDKNSSVKGMAYRTILALLNIRVSDFLLKQYLTQVEDEEEQRSIEDLVYKILEKTEESDDEENEL